LPFRSIIEALPVGAEQVPRDAKAGTGPAIVEVPGIGRVGVVISWEVFFAGRAREAVVNGGQLILNPTNGASYTGTILQTQQVASSRLRAIETGRAVVQVAPTGFSAFVSSDGAVQQRTAQVEAKVLTQPVELRSGRTWAVRLGDRPWIALIAIILGALRGWLRWPPAGLSLRARS
jgi:apolipoprotein N-acyltransferase